MQYVYSTLSNSVAYAIYSGGNKEIDVIERSIIINGGANLANKFLLTPRGVMTEVNDKDFEILLSDYHFKEHVKNGFITYDKKSVDIDKVVKNMKSRDGSSPKIPDDYLLDKNASQPEGMGKEKR